MPSFQRRADDPYWRNSFVEEANLTVNISARRKALGDRADGREYIETVPKKGYRFVADVTKLLQESEAAKRLVRMVGRLEDERAESRGSATLDPLRPRLPFRTRNWFPNRQPSYAVHGDPTSALRVLQLSIESGFFAYPHFVGDPLLGSMRTEHEFAPLVEKAQRHERFRMTFF